MSEWEPIETAPKEASILLAKYEPKVEPYWFWITSGEFSEGRFYDDWSDDDGCPVECMRAGFRKPTHWMPLPEPPGE